MIIEQLPEQTEQGRPKNLVELVARYKESSWYSNLAYKTQKDYEHYILALLKSPYGLQPINKITRFMASTIYTRLKDEHGERSAAYFVAVWSRIFKFAIKYDFVIINPWTFLEVTKSEPRGVTWTEDQVFTAVNKALEAGFKGLAQALCLMYDTGQRPIDILYLQYKHIKEDAEGFYAEITQTKRGAKVKPALSKYTIGILGGEEFLRKAPPEGSAVEGVKNKPLLNSQFAKLKKMLPAEFSELQMRDLRRSAITEMGAASDDQMISVSGHSDRDMLNIYSVRNRTKALQAQRTRYATRNSKLNTEFPGFTGEQEEV